VAARTVSSSMRMHPTATVKLRFPRPPRSWPLRCSRAAHRFAAAMLPHHRGQPVGTAVSRRLLSLYDTWAAELTSSGERVWLGTFSSLEEVAHAYNTVCWRFGHVREWLNYNDVASQAHAVEAGGRRSRRLLDGRVEAPPL
jgi:hypothetical protein